ncbi:MAG: Pyrroline-5-carboxylate reductase [Gammaproteobacteria bacterium]|nr:Pyrroline-5-carboxylate reductase [Gammaproteobacteria bacterium]
MKRAQICCIGCGNMGRSLLGGILANGYPLPLLCGADPDPAQRETIRTLFGIETLADNREAIENARIVILAVKPQLMAATVKGIAPALVKLRPLIISVAAGIRLSAITGLLRQELPVIRAMPNTPALIQAGATALYANAQVTDEHKESAETIMRSVGTVVWVEHESVLDTVTALSGSGPAYFFLVMEILEKAAIDMGLHPDQARLLTLETALGAAKMALESNLDTASLRRQVTSPGGTTERALAVLTQGKIEALFQQALKAAQQRSIELADEFGKS